MRCIQATSSWPHVSAGSCWEFLPACATRCTWRLASLLQAVDSVAKLSCIPERSACMLCHLHSPNCCAYPPSAQPVADLLGGCTEPGVCWDTWCLCPCPCETNGLHQALMTSKHSMYTDCRPGEAPTSKIKHVCTCTRTNTSTCKRTLYAKKDSRVQGILLHPLYGGQAVRWSS